MQLRPVIAGKRVFDNTPVTATDPCYPKTSFHVVRDIAVKPGDYRCVAWKGRCYYTDRETHKRHSYSRIFICGIYLDGKMPNMDDGIEIGHVGVDAGLAGFFQNKPDYEDAEWFDFCDRINEHDWLITPEGFCTESGFGDGYYPVYKFVNDKGEIVGLEIRFE